MSKLNNNVNENLTSHINDSLEESSFAVSNEQQLKQLYWNLLNIIKELDTLISSSFNNTYLMASAKNMIDNNNTIANEFQQKLNNSHNINRELYHVFETKLEQINQIYNDNLKLIDDDCENDIRIKIDELLKFQQEAITRYKTVENSFLPKTNFLSHNKKVNKDEYIKVVTNINHERITSNQNYTSIASDYSSKNEQQQYQFKHTLDASIEKNTYDISIIKEEAAAQIEQLNQEFDIEEKNKTHAINIKHRKIIDNTIELNEIITNITNEYKTKLDNAYKPFTENEIKFQEEITTNDKTYKELEEKVLDEFKTLLQQNDIEIENSRKEHVKYEDEYKKQIRQAKKEFNTKLKKELSSFNKKIEAAERRYLSTQSEHDKEILDKLLKEKKNFAKQTTKTHQEEIEKLNNEFLEYQLAYIEKIERLRTKKSQCEAIKSSAVKNINYEKIYNVERLNAEKSFNTSEKEIYGSIDHLEENKTIYSKRLEYDKINEGIRLEINEIDIDLYQDEIEHRNEVNKVILTRDYNIALSNADLDYQRNIIENRQNFHNVKTMLDIQKENIINKYELLLVNEKMDFEQKKSLFYNNCDNLQYELFQNNNQLKYKLIDEEINHNQEVGEVEKQHIIALSNYKKRILQNKKAYTENLEHIKLYEERLVIEKNMFYNAYEHYKNSLLNIIDFENYIFSLCVSLPSYCFENNKNRLLLMLEYTKKLKLNLLNDYHNNLIAVINSRIEFEKDVKYKNILENLKQEWEELESYSKSKIDKLNKTIQSYQATVETSKEALKKTIKQLKNLDKNTPNYANEHKILEEQIIALNKQIRVNKNSITKQTNIRNEQISKIISAEKKYHDQHDRIEKNNANEAKIYNKSILLIHQQHQKLKTELLKNSSHLSITKHNVDLEKNLQKAKATNNFLLITSKNNFDINYSILNTSITKQYNTIKETGEKSNNRITDEIQKLLAMEEKEYSTSKLTITNYYHNVIDSLYKNSKDEREKILDSLKEVTNKHNENLIASNNLIKSIESKREYELKCHKDNYEMYLEKYNKNNVSIVNEYLQKIEKIKKDYKSKIAELELKLKNSHKQINSQHLSNETLYKNNILAMNNEYKEYIKKTLVKINDIEAEERKIKNIRDEQITKYHNAYIVNQRDTRKEFENQTKIIESKCNSRINIMKKDFRRKFAAENKK